MALSPMIGHLVSGDQGQDFLHPHQGRLASGPIRDTEAKRVSHNNEAGMSDSVLSAPSFLLTPMSSTSPAPSSSPTTIEKELVPDPTSTSNESQMAVDELESSNGGTTAPESSQVPESNTDSSLVATSENPAHVERGETPQAQDEPDEVQIIPNPQPESCPLECFAPGVVHPMSLQHLTMDIDFQRIVTESPSYGISLLAKYPELNNDPAIWLRFALVAGSHWMSPQAMTHAKASTVAAYWKGVTPYLVSSSFDYIPVRLVLTAYLVAQTSRNPSPRFRLELPYEGHYELLPKDCQPSQDGWRIV